MIPKMRGKVKKVAVSLLACSMIATWSPVAFTKSANEVKAAAMSTSRVSVHDPSIVKANGQYYLFGSHMADAVSSNLTSWNTITTNINYDYANVFRKAGTWSAHGSSSYNISGNLWAPDVIYNRSMRKWCMYMSVNGDRQYSSIAMATADNVTGPYTYAGTVVYSGFVNLAQARETDYARVTGTNNVDGRYLRNGAWNTSYGTNAIDPCVTYDKDGNLWMAYGSWFGGIFLLKLDANTGLRDYSYTYQTITNESDQYLGKRISGGYGTSGEGAYIVWDPATQYYYLYESYCGLNATDSFSGYHIRLFRSRNITGPYTDASGNNAVCTSASNDKSRKGIKLFGNYSFSSFSSAGGRELNERGYMSGGHNSALIDDDGQRYLIYHTRFNRGTEEHQVRVHQQFMNEDGWPVTAVYEYLGSRISQSGYSSEDIVGTYEVVNHQLAAKAEYTGMLPTQKIALKADGTIAGSYQGNWTERQGSYYCTMTISGVTYKGVFFKQYDESSAHKETMTFTLIGNDNKAIWGSKISNDCNVSNSDSSTSAKKLDGVYYIKNGSSKLYLDVYNGQTSDGTNIRQWSYNGCEAQKFKLVSDGSGNYYVLTGASGYKSCLDVDSGSSSDGANIMQWNCWGGEMQKFKVEDLGNGKFAFYTKASNYRSCLDLYEVSPNAGANICQWNYWGGEGQQWILEPATSGDSIEGTYFFKNCSSGLYLDVYNGQTSDGTNIRQWHFNGCDAQKFKIVSDGNGYYSILTGASGYKSCLDVDSGSAADGANIMQWNSWGGEMQKFKIHEVENGNYVFLTKASNLNGCLDLYEVSPNAGANICQWSYWGGLGQQWKLERTY
ncbi:RICIN domain-containing protein [[Clostridium] polysaccharolyticum]|uniref:Arabinan endo-1,5-alpha-L-arabinosidase n=1 Tax=[Clostridium] polysaccharolyticum TaxID=29364 RepID=A0A1I0BLF8_9FIRM|nr:RICIN domain-containing protein [[Clostridium] polysaccharolyticum]SET07795.1 arabinan endo-1,5-alpha-L-arabinosidase [[Clostridium] polysaccharolyticum]